MHESIFLGDCQVTGFDFGVGFKFQPWKGAARILKSVNRPFEGAERWAGHALAPLRPIAEFYKRATTLGFGAGDIVFHFAEGLAQGKSVSDAMRHSLNETRQDVLVVGPVAQSVVSVVPGIGTGVSMAIGAGVALANGKRIDDVFIDAAAGAIPGGPAAQAAVKAGAKIGADLLAHRSIDTALLDAAKTTAINAGSAIGVPSAVTSAAFDAGIAIGHGKKIQEVGLDLAQRALSEGAKAIGVPAPSDIAKKILSDATKSAGVTVSIPNLPIGLRSIPMTTTTTHGYNNYGMGAPPEPPPAPVAAHPASATHAVAQDAAQAAATASGADTSHPAVQAAVNAAAQGAAKAVTALPPSTPSAIVQQQAVHGAQAAIAAEPAANHPAVQAAVPAAATAAAATHPAVIASLPSPVITPPVVPAAPPAPPPPVVTHPAIPAAPPAPPPPVVTHPAFPAAVPLPLPVVTHPQFPATPAVTPAAAIPAPQPAAHERLQQARSEHDRRRQELSAAVTAAVASGDQDRWRREYQRFQDELREYEQLEQELTAAMQYEQPYEQLPATPLVNTYYLYRYDPMAGWTPVASSWLSFADVQKWMNATDPNAQYGAYDQNMNWQSMSNATSGVLGQPESTSVLRVLYSLPIVDSAVVRYFQNLLAIAITGQAEYGSFAQNSKLTTADYNQNDVDGNPGNPRWMHVLSVFQAMVNGIININPISVFPGFPAQLRADGVLDFATAIAIIGS